MNTLVEFDKLVVAVSNGENKEYLFSSDERIQIVKKALFSDLKLNKKYLPNYIWNNEKIKHIHFDKNTFISNKISEGCKYIDTHYISITCSQGL